MDVSFYVRITNSKYYVSDSCERFVINECIFLNIFFRNVTFYLKKTDASVNADNHRIRRKHTSTSKVNSVEYQTEKYYTYRKKDKKIHEAIVIRRDKWVWEDHAIDKIKKSWLTEIISMKQKKNIKGTFNSLYLK